MKRTLRFLAAPAATLLLLASCGTSDEPAPAEDTATQEAPQADAEPADEEQADDSDSWPIVEDEDGNVVENPEDQPMDDGGDDTAIEEGNDTTVEFGDETLELDVQPMIDSQLPTTGRYYLEGMTGVQAIAEIGVEGPAGIEAFRESIGADPVTYIRFDVDNRGGSEEILMLELNMYDSEGQEYKFETLTSASNDWTEGIEDYTDEQYELSQKTEEYDGAAVGQRNEQWLIGPGDLPEEVASMAGISELFIDEFYPIPVA